MHVSYTVTPLAVVAITPCLRRHSPLRYVAFPGDP